MADTDDDTTGIELWHWAPVVAIGIPGLVYGTMAASPSRLGETIGGSLTVLVLTVVCVAAYRKLSLSKWDPMPKRGWQIIVALSSVFGVLVGFFYPPMSGAGGYVGGVFWLLILGYPIAIIVNAGKYGVARITG